MSQAREDAVALIANALLIEPVAVDERTALGISPEWDSLAHLRLILALEEQLGRQLGPEAIVGIADFGDVVTLLNGAA